MMRLIGRMTGIALAVAVATMPGLAAEQNGGKREIQATSGAPTRAPARDEPMYMAKPLSHWLKSIQNRDEEMERAFEAIRVLGPDAWEAVPELSQIVGAPFTPVRVGVDKRELIISKLLNVRLRSDAIDALTAIGPAGASSSVILIHWALSAKVIRGYTGRIEDAELFIDLVTMDILQRMRVVGAVSEFGRGAIPAIVALLTSDADDERKLAVAILNEKAVPIAGALLKSQDCEDRRLGMAILVDMWPVVPEEHLIGLKSALVCNSDDFQ